MERKQIVVVGLGRFGSDVARTLFQEGHDVLAIDENEALVQEMLDQTTHAVQGDATHEDVLRELGVPGFDAAVVAIGSNIQANILCAALLKGFNIPLVVARANNQLHGRILERIGADLVVYPEQEMGVRLAHNLFKPQVQEYLELAENYGISKLRAPKAFSKLSLQEAGLSGMEQENYDLAVLAIRRGKDVLLFPNQNERLWPDDVLFVLSRGDLLEQLLAEAGKHRQAQEQGSP